MCSMVCFTFPSQQNEPVLSYAPGSSEREELQKTLQYMIDNPVEVPIMIDGEEAHSGHLVAMHSPHNLKQSLGTYHQANASHAHKAIDAANKAKREWSVMPWSDRATGSPEGRRTTRRQIPSNTQCGDHAVHEQDLLPGRNRFRLRVDRLLALQPLFHDPDLRRPAPNPATKCSTTWSTAPSRASSSPLPPFNFTSIAGNLPTAPALMGNAVVWKPASSAVLPAYYLMKLLKEAGHARRRHQYGARRRLGHRAARPRPPRLGRHPLHRKHPSFLHHLARGRLRHPQILLLSAHRRRNRRQRLHLRARIRGHRRARHRTSPRGLRVPRAEMLRRQPPRLHSRQ